MRRRIVESWNRFYDPATGRYISADPIGLDGGMNLYAYVGGDPVNAVDPWGLMSDKAKCEAGCIAIGTAKVVWLANTHGFKVTKCIRKNITNPIKLGKCFGTGPIKEKAITIGEWIQDCVNQCQPPKCGKGQLEAG